MESALNKNIFKPTLKLKAEDISSFVFLINNKYIIEKFNIKKIIYY